MSTALVVYKHNFPANRGHEPTMPLTFSDRTRMLPKVPFGRDSVYGRSDWSLVEEQTGSYGPDAKIISPVFTGLIIDTFG